VQLPAGATQERTLKVLEQVERHFLENETKAVDAVMAIIGFSFGGRGQNMGVVFVKLKDWDERHGAELRAPAVARRAMGAFSKIKDGLVFAFTPPAVAELGQANGFDFQLEDRGGLGHEKLTEARNQLLGMAAKNPVLTAVRPNGQDDTSQFKIDIDDVRAGALGVALADANSVLGTAWGGAYVGDFVQDGRIKRVYVQGDAAYRMLPEDIGAWRVRTRAGEMVPFSAFTTSRWTYGSPRLERYNGAPSMEIMGQAAPGRSSGDAMLEMEKLAAQLPAGIGYEWTGLSYEERAAGAQAPLLYAISLLVVFLSLAALYESWAVPFSVMLVVPLGVIGAVLASTSRGYANDVYFQIAILTTIGLAAKNAILIVEFAEAQMEHGKGLIEATLEGARLRLRPILMTSLAFFFGVVPLVLTKGAGAGAQNALGTAVNGGMATATILAIFFVPVFFVAVRRLFPVKLREDAASAAAAAVQPEVN
jgi:multidrug efflux pump